MRPTRPLRRLRRSIRGRRTKPLDDWEASALRSLAALLRAGMSPRSSLRVWAEHAQGDPTGRLRKVGRRAQLGGELSWCIAGYEGLAAPAVGALFAAQARAGGDLAAMLDAVAASLDARAVAVGIAQAHASGARLSARVVAWLPLAFLAFVPGAVPELDAAGLSSGGLGVVLCLMGVLWIRRLTPRPDQDPDPAEIATVVCAASARAGSDHRIALETLASGPGAGEELRRASRRVRLGFTWGQALTRCSREGYRTLGDGLRRSELSGAGFARGLERALAEARSHRRARQEATARRAAFKMVVPLTLCVLPGFLILAITPHLQELTP